MAITDARTAEEQFYTQYAWCVNPPLRVQDLLARLREEADRYDGLSEWQREESRANLYLFVCAVACTADDYLAFPGLNLTPVSKRVPKIRPAVAAAQNLLDLIHPIVQSGDRAAWEWRRNWDACVQHACRLLLCEPALEAQTFADLRAALSRAEAAPLPQALLKRRMRLPEAFRAQDMAHQDVITLVERFCDSFAPDRNPVQIMGLRTAGAYFAPLMAEYLKLRGWSDVSWFSIRPKQGASRREQQQLTRAVQARARILVVDDYPSTGKTFRMTLDILSRAAVPPEHTVVLAPTHAAQPDWPRLARIDPKIPIITIDPADLHKNRFLRRAADIEALCAGYYAREGWTQARILRDDRIDAMNARLAEHSKDGHHVREKRVFAIELSRPGGEAAVKRVFLKSAGWGWLGYHAYIAAGRLNEFVPPLLGLRCGMLVTEWSEGESPAASPEPDSVMVRTLARYTAARSQRLGLTADCRFENRTYRWTGSDEILGILRAVYGPYINRFKAPALRKQLHKYMSARPTFIDGRMRMEEWICTPAETYKTDFEHHNFGGGEPDIVDPAYDLAAAIFEFRLTADSERELLRIYERESGDDSVHERLLLHKLLYASVAMRHAHHHAARGRDAHANNARLHDARNFLVYSMADFCADRIAVRRRRARWSGPLFFLDLDGVFDQELLGFPHATQSGLRSLALLQAHEFSVVLNTGRSVQHVRRYCEAYGLPGGVAEFGAVFVDAAGGREISFIDSLGAEQLGACREAIQQLPGVFIDPSYEYAIRAYRFTPAGTAGLQRNELKQFLSRPEFSNLKPICRGPDSYIVPKRTGKGAAARAVRRELAGMYAPMTAIGDSQYDIGMLNAAEYAYAPANCSPGVRKLAKNGACRIMKQRFQNGLLAAVRHRLSAGSGRAACDEDLLAAQFTLQENLIDTLLKVADRRFALQCVGLLNWRRL